MIRNCFLRNSKLSLICSETWDLPVIGKQKIGFSLCSKSGLILQSPSIEPAIINRYYSDAATYINPGTQGKPSIKKARALNRFINVTLDIIGYIPPSVFQIGCSDGYTLFRFSEAGAKKVHGIDPSKASHEIAKKFYDINSTVGTIESYQTKNEKWGLVVLTHVLEHLYNPLAVMFKIYEMQKVGSHILIEVPLFERLDKLCPGLFSLEHLNYFSEGTLIEMIGKAGYTPLFISKSFDLDIYPVITVVAEKKAAAKVIKSKDFKKNKKLFLQYLAQEKKTWMSIDKYILSSLNYSLPTYIYGAGVHTSQLLARTQIRNKVEIAGIYDSSPTKWDKLQADCIIKPMEKGGVISDCNIIISSYASEFEIYKFLIQNVSENCNIICLHGSDKK